MYRVARRTTSHRRQEEVWAWILIALATGREMLTMFGYFPEGKSRDREHPLL